MDKFNTFAIAWLVAFALFPPLMVAMTVLLPGKVFRWSTTKAIIVGGTVAYLLAVISAVGALITLKSLCR